MTFSYEVVTPRVKRPIIPILLKSKNTFIFDRALVDSGADNCIFSIDIANLLGIKLSQKDMVPFSGISQGKVVGYWSELTIRVGKVAYATPVIFAEISNFGHGIQGQRGFFDHFDVRLSYQRQVIEIEPI